MDTEKDKDGCCAKSKCCGKALAAIGLLAIGGLGGYLAGKRCGAGRMCATEHAAPAAPAAPAAK